MQREMRELWSLELFASLKAGDSRDCIVSSNSSFALLVGINLVVRTDKWDAFG